MFYASQQCDGIGNVAPLIVTDRLDCVGQYRQRMFLRGAQPLKFFLPSHHAFKKDTPTTGVGEVRDRGTGSEKRSRG